MITLSYVQLALVYPTGINTMVQYSWNYWVQRPIGMPDSFTIWLSFFKIALPPAVIKVYDTLTMLHVKHELSFALFPTFQL
jgi:hypothetical protein